jgi:hypothetical protein
MASDSAVASSAVMSSPEAVMAALYAHAMKKGTRSCLL